MNVVFLALLLATTPDDDAAALLQLAAAKQQMLAAQKPVVPTAPKQLTFSEASAMALKESKPLILFLNGTRVTDYRVDVPGCVTCSVDSLDGFTGPVVVVCNSSGYWRATLPAWSTVADIQKEVGRKVVTFPAQPQYQPQQYRPVLQFQSSGIDCSGGT